MRRARLPSGLIPYSAALALAAVFLVPLVWVLSSSFKSEKEIYSTGAHFFPLHPTADNYRSIASALPQFPHFMLNSAIVTAISVTAVAFIAAAAAYPLARLRFSGRKLVFSFVLLAVAIPYVLYLVPIYVVEANANLLNSIPGLVLPYIALNLPLAIILMEGSYRTIPREFEDAARIDGCSPFRVWWSIMLPLAGPGIASVVIFTFVAVWQEFMFAVTLFGSGNDTTFPVGITFLRAEGQSYAFGQLSATVVLALIPALAVFLLLQKYFVQGLLEGGLKG